MAPEISFRTLPLLPVGSGQRLLGLLRLVWYKARMKKKLLRVILIFSLVGMAASLVSTNRYFEILQKGFEKKSFCNISETVNCDVVYASSAAKMGGIPVSWFGFVYYLLTAAMAGWILSKKEEERPVASFAWLLTLGGIAVSAHMAWLSLFVIQAVCLLCLAMDAVTLAIFFSWHGYLGLGLKHFSRLSLKPKLVTMALLTLAVFGLGWGLIHSYQNKVAGKLSLEIPIDQIVQFHFRQSEYQFEPDPVAPVWGNPQAKITVVEFSDFQCPFCKEAAFRLKPMLAEFKDKIRFYFYNYPLDPSCNPQIQGDGHDKACLAAEAAACANKMGNFWNYHDEAFRNQKNLSRELLLELAKKEGWNEQAFAECIDSPQTLEEVKKEVEAGNKIFVTGTPTLLINNRRVKYWTDPDVFKAILKEEIRRSRTVSR